MRVKTEPFKINTSKLNEKTQHRSLVDQNSDQILQISQSQINFVNTQMNQLYQISINVRNVSQISQKIKIRKPLNNCFTVQVSKQGGLAAGLQMKLTVLFDSKQNVRKSDRVVVMTQSYEIEIPVNVYPHVGKLEFEPFINFGFVKTGTVAEANWNIMNRGDTGIKIKLTPLIIEQTTMVDLSSEEVYLQSGQKKTITISLSSKVSGTVEGSIEIEPKILGYSTLEFVANFCEYNRIFSDSQGNEVKLITLDPLFGGQNMKINSFIVNNSPEGCQFRITRKKGSGDDNVTLITP